jgi:hypothetical protein
MATAARTLRSRRRDHSLGGLIEHLPGFVSGARMDTPCGYFEPGCRDCDAVVPRVLVDAMAASVDVVLHRCSVPLQG